MVYAVSAHPDDEMPAWGVIERRPQIYTVFVLMTKGEQTFSCKTIEESVPNDDRRPRSPVTLVQANLIDPVTERRIGPYVVNYEWLFDTYAFQGDPNLGYWQRFG